MERAIGPHSAGLGARAYFSETELGDEEGRAKAGRPPEPAEDEPLKLCEGGGNKLDELGLSW